MLLGDHDAHYKRREIIVSQSARRVSELTLGWVGRWAVATWFVDSTVPTWFVDSTACAWAAAWTTCSSSDTYCSVTAGTVGFRAATLSWCPSSALRL